MNLIPLSVIDQVFIGADAYPIDFTFEFNKGMSPEKMLRALTETLKDFPPLRSTLKNSPNSNQWYFEPVDIAPYFKVRSNLDQVLDSVITLPGEPLLKVVFSQGSDKDVLGVSMSHAVADGFSYFYFLNAWFSRMQGRAYLAPEFDRSTLEDLSQGPSINVETSTDFFAATGFHWLPDTPRSKVGPVTYHRRIFEGQIKPAIENQSDRSISANAWLSAEVLSQWTLNQSLTTDFIYLSCAIDLRQRARDYVKPNYFGNAICGAGVRWAKSDLLKLPVSTTALQIHQAVANTNSLRAKQVIATLGSMFRKHGSALSECLHVANPSSGILITNLSRLALETLDGGAGSPNSFAIHTRAPNTIAVTSHNKALILNSCLLAGR